MQLIFLFVLYGFSTIVAELEDVTLGTEMVFRAWDSVGWYEAFKKFPESDINHYNTIPQIRGWYINKYFTSSGWQNSPDEIRLEKFGESFQKQGLRFLPPAYGQKCNKYFSKPDESPAQNQSDALNDGQKNYPFKAAAYCMIHHLRETYGKEAIEELKLERTHGKKDWRQTILDRDNKFRARHDSPPFLLDERLNEAAQKYANKLATECKIYHSSAKDREDGDRKYVGENLASVYLYDTMDFSISAYIASNSWYNEIKQYPYITEIVNSKSPESQALLTATGHFTQTVWRNTTLVGYGQTCNPKCLGNSIQGGCYIVGRYYMAGNRVGKGEFFKENVCKPKD